MCKKPKKIWNFEAIEMTLNIPRTKYNLTYHFTIPIPSASSPHLIKNQMIFMM